MTPAMPALRGLLMLAIVSLAAVPGVLLPRTSLDEPASPVHKAPTPAPQTAVPLAATVSGVESGLERGEYVNSVLPISGTDRASYRLVLANRRDTIQSRLVLMRSTPDQPDWRVADSLTLQAFPAHEMQLLVGSGPIGMSGLGSVSYTHVLVKGREGSGGFLSYRVYGITDDHLVQIAERSPGKGDVTVVKGAILEHEGGS